MDLIINDIRQALEDISKETGSTIEKVKAEFQQHIDNLEVFDPFFEIPFSDISESSKTMREQIIINALFPS
jgi:hypothetical protein